MTLQVMIRMHFLNVMFLGMMTPELINTHECPLMTILIASKNRSSDHRSLNLDVSDVVSFLGEC